MSDERKIQEILARYVRATGRRDGKALVGGDRAHLNAQWRIVEHRVLMDMPIAVPGAGL